MTASTPLVHIRGLVKEYRALRPLRIQDLQVRPSEVVSISGLDAQAAEILITLITGASLPDQGEVRLFGANTAEITDSAAWLQSLDGIGMVSARVVLLDQYSVRQNIAMALTLDIDPVAADVRSRVDRLADEAGIEPGRLDVPVGGIGPDLQMRVRLARALALQPALLLAEHPSATVSRPGVEALGADLSRIGRSRGLGILAVTADQAFARALGGTALALDPASGAWRPQSLWSRVAGALSRPK